MVIPSPLFRDPIDPGIRFFAEELLRWRYDGRSELAEPAAGQLTVLVASFPFLSLQ